jgi:hypothetical protein
MPLTYYEWYVAVIGSTNLIVFHFLRMWHDYCMRHCIGNGSCAIQWFPTCFPLIPPTRPLLYLLECRIHKCSPIIPILSRINTIPRIDTYFLKFHSNIVLPSTPRPPKCSLSCWFTCKYFKGTPTFFHSGYMTCPSQSPRLNNSVYIRWTVQTMKFLIMEQSPHSHPSWIQIFASRSYSQKPLVCILPLMWQTHTHYFVKTVHWSRHLHKV